MCSSRNAPYHLGFRAVTFALAAGNTTILKGPELSPRCYWAIADVFRQAGLPDGCLNLIFHRPEDAGPVTEQLIENVHVRKINFTGSSHVGSIIAALAGKHLKPCLMELGGKASAIVMPDADLEAAALSCAMGSFMNASLLQDSNHFLFLTFLTSDESRLAKFVCLLSASSSTPPLLLSSSPSSAALSFEHSKAPRAPPW